jgi:hypothetical protein
MAGRRGALIFVANGQAYFKGRVGGADRAALPEGGTCRKRQAASPALMNPRPYPRWLESRRSEPQSSQPRHDKCAGQRNANEQKFFAKRAQIRPE